MRKVLVVLMVAGFVLAMSGTAVAEVRGTRCTTHTHRRQSGVVEGVRVCTSVNWHDFWGYDEGHATVDQAPGYPLVNQDNVEVYVDFLKLFVNGDLKRQTNPDRWYVGVPFTHTTDWWTIDGHDNCYSKFDYKIKWAGGDVTNPIGVLQSGTVVC